MNNLRSLLKSFFSETCPITEYTFFKKKYLNSDDSLKEQAPSIFKWLKEFDNYSNDDLNNLNSKFVQDWGFLPNKDKSLASSVFNTLIHFTNQTLVEENNEPLVIYENLLRWKELSLHIGEDILTTSYFAFSDLKSHKERHFFSWKPHLLTDNKRLQSILNQGIAENHAHLYASGLNFDFSWIALMNNHQKLRPAIQDFYKEKRKHLKVNESFEESDFKHSDLLEIAMVFRLFIYHSIEYFKEDNNLKSLLIYLKEALELDVTNLASDCHLQLKSISQRAKKEIDYLKAINSLQLDNNSKKESFDYLIPKEISKKNLDSYYYLYGERKILYDSFKVLYSSEIKSNESKALFEKMLYIYVLIKNDFRKELIQLNGRFGFDNFKKYQDDKFQFLGDKYLKTKLYAKAYLDVVFNLNPKQMNIVSSEYRITPPKGVLNFVSEIKGYDSLIESKRIFNARKRIRKTKKYSKAHDKPFYVIHFLKKNDRSFKKETINSYHVPCRHSDLRRSIRREAFKIVEIREKHPLVANQIKGIDAASSEFATRPEVFAQAFRFLKYHHLKEEHHLFKKHKSNKLRLTFHAGEDFYDIVDGLRYIDESIKFLGLSSFDRIGHALALGIDAWKFYNLKGNTLLLSKQMLLDNLVWLIAKTKKYALYEKHISMVKQLEHQLSSLISEVYTNPINIKYSKADYSKSNLSVYNKLNYSPELFYDSWKLRGDCPNVYDKYFTEGLEILSVPKMRYWDRCAINDRDHKLDMLRQRKDVCFLYYEYHFNSQIRMIGEEIRQFKITTKYIDLVADVQHCMLQTISYKNIGIECNPSSNLLIGTIGKYINHPIFKFNSKGLDFKDNHDSPLASVSINTDDSGVFHTSLENEYALLAIALEKEKDELGNPKFKPNDIYDWIDHVRKMGLQQSFKN